MLKSTALCFIAGILVGCTCGSVLADGAALDTLKSKYGVGIVNIERTTDAAYTNGLCSLMQQFKSSGHLDAFLLLQKELKAFAAMPIIPTGQVREDLSAKVPGFRDMMSKLDVDRTAQIAELQRQYTIRLDALMKELMTADQIEDAKRVKEEKDSLLLRASQQPDKAISSARTDAAQTAPADIVAPTPTSQPASIPADAMTYKGHRYLLVKDPTTWEEARKACEGMGGHLLILDDDSELQFVMKNLMADPDVFIGASFDGLRWRWLNGTVLNRDKYQLPPRSDVSAGLSGWAYRGSEGRVKGLYQGSMDGQHLYICEWDDAAPDDEPKQKSADPYRNQPGGAAPVKELLIIKATLVGIDSPLDVTALLQERVVDGKLIITDFSFLPDRYRSYYYYGARNRDRGILIQYKYRGGLSKTIKKKSGEPIAITE